MKIWPIITLAGLIWGSFYADGRNTERESKPHPRPLHSALDDEIKADFAPLAMPHRVATISFRSFFAQMMQEETEWTAPQRKETAEVDADSSDDGEDPGKKLFWTTLHPETEGVPFTGWADPNPVPNPDPVVPPYSGNLPPGFTVTFEIISDPGPPREDENVATTTNAHILQLPFGALKALNNIVPVGPGEVTILPCETVLVNGICPAPCKKDDPLCKSDGQPPVAGLPPGLPDPGDPVGSPPPIIDPNPITSGGGGGGGGRGGLAGGVPEPSTWVLFGIGFLALAGLKWRFSAAR